MKELLKEVNSTLVSFSVEIKNLQEIINMQNQQIEQLKRIITQGDNMSEINNLPESLKKELENIEKKYIQITYET
jgi:hypothetical protein